MYKAKNLINGAAFSDAAVNTELCSLYIANQMQLMKKQANVWLELKVRPVL